MPNSRTYGYGTSGYVMVESSASGANAINVTYLLPFVRASLAVVVRLSVLRRVAQQAAHAGHCQS